MAFSPKVVFSKWMDCNLGRFGMDLGSPCRLTKRCGGQLRALLIWLSQDPSLLNQQLIFGGMPRGTYLAVVVTNEASTAHDVLVVVPRLISDKLDLCEINQWWNLMKRLLMAVSALLVCGVAMADYQSGQVWEYKTRPGEESSRLYIAKVDEDERLGKIFHIYIDGLRIENPNVAPGFQSELPHAPVDTSTLDASVTSLVGIIEDVPDVSEGYRYWREAFNSGQGGVFDIPVAEIIDYIEQVVNQ